MWRKRHVQRKYVFELVPKFQDTKSMTNKMNLKPQVKLEAVQVRVLGQVAVGPAHST